MPVHLPCTQVSLRSLGLLFLVVVVAAAAAGLADGAAEELTGYVHGAVTPVGARCVLLGSRGQLVAGGGGGGGTEVPVVLSSRVARLPEVWMGAGEVDLKLCVSTREFVERYDPIVADVMHGDGGGEGEDDD